MSTCVNPKQDKEISRVPFCQILIETTHRQQDQARAGFYAADLQAHSNDGHTEVLEKPGVSSFRVGQPALCGFCGPP